MNDEVRLFMWAFAFGCSGGMAIGKVLNELRSKEATMSVPNAITNAVFAFCSGILSGLIATM